MRFSRQITIATFTIVAFVYAHNVQAAPASSAFFGGEINDASDIDGDQLFKGTHSDGMGGMTPNTGGSTVEVGDYLLAVIHIDQILEQGGGSNSLLGPAYNELTAVSLIKVAAVGATSTILGVDFAPFTFVAPTIAEWTAVTTAAGYAYTPTAVGTMAMIFDGGSTHDWDASGTIATGLSTSDGTLMWEAGFTGTIDDKGTASIDDDTRASSAAEEWTAFAPKDFSALRTSVTAQSLSFVHFGVNVTATGPAAGGVDLLPTTAWDGVLYSPGETQFQGNGGFNPHQKGSEFGGTSHTDIYVFATPEPASTVMFAMGSFVLAGCGYRRRRRDAKLAA